MIDIRTADPIADFAMWRGTLTDAQVEAMFAARSGVVHMPEWARSISDLLERLRLPRLAARLRRRTRTVAAWSTGRPPA